MQDIYGADDLVARLVLVPCSQEARGLDAGPRLVQRLISNSDHRSAAIVQKIADEELAHVAVGAAFSLGPLKKSYQRQIDSLMEVNIVSREFGTTSCHRLAIGFRLASASFTSSFVQVVIGFARFAGPWVWRRGLPSGHGWHTCLQI